MNARLQRTRQVLLAVSTAGVVAGAALLPASVPASTSDTPAGAALAFQVNEPAPGFDPNPLCLCPICTSLRDGNLDVPGGAEVTPGAIPIV